MTVEELIVNLNNYPKDMKVVVNGYESGFDDIDEICIEKVYYENGAHYDGVYQTWGDKKEKFEVLALHR